VFGSRARGDADAESDMDVFLEIAEDGVDVRRRISDAAWQVGYDNGVIICNLILTSDEMANSPQRYSNCVETALEEGVPV
jgi:predicted nucleotidyltransferase